MADGRFPTASYIYDITSLSILPQKTPCQLTNSSKHVKKFLFTSLRAVLHPDSLSAGRRSNLMFSLPNAFASGAIPFNVIPAPMNVIPAPINVLPAQESVSEFDQTVIPGEPRKPAPYSIRGWARSGIQENHGKSNHSGSRLASRAAGLGRDDKLRLSLRKGREHRARSCVTKIASLVRGSIYFMNVTSSTFQ